MRMRSRGCGLLFVLCAALSLPVSAQAAVARAVAPRSVLEADSLVRTVANPARDRFLAEWAKRASMNELVWLLRRPASELGSAEPVLLDAALAQCAPARTSLRDCLLARRALAVPQKPARKGEPVWPSLAALRPYASVYRVAVITPDLGEYGGIGPVLRAALLEGLHAGRAPGALAFAMDSAGTGDSDPVLVAAAAESLFARSDVIVGELLSPPTTSLATAARVSGHTLVSPTATDERIGRMGPQVFQLGPSAALRGRRLATRMSEGSPTPVIAVLGSRASLAAPFASAFTAEARERTGREIAQHVLPQDPAAIAALARTVKGSNASVLMCDASARELEPLVRALASEGASVRMCGGTALAPEGFRASARPLLEGVTYIDDGWRLPAADRSRLDSLAVATGTRAGSVWTRGWLVGRAIARAVDGGACTAHEVADALRKGDAWLAERGFLDVSPEGATLPLYTVHNGRSIVLSDTQ
ncbi:MAG: ABC transporter substrate-binding protein [Candidatus Eisenbacteria bacterium]|nr:ABC transporter substrate-binding protein [Candidatus Eisenbacteria bacterium]